MTSDTIDYFMSQPDGANYVVLYQMLCLKTINTGGRLSRQIGEVIIPYDIPKIQRDCKWFSADTIRVALEMYKAFGLIYEDIDGTLVLADHNNLVGSETDAAARMRNSRNKTQELPSKSGVTSREQCSHNVTPENRDVENRDKSLDRRDADNRDKSLDKKSKKKKTDVFSEFAGGNQALLAALRDFECMRVKIKKPMTELAKERLISKLKNDFAENEWVSTLNQSVDLCWQSVYPLKGEFKPQQKNNESPNLNNDMDELQRAYNLICGGK